MKQSGKDSCPGQETLVKTALTVYNFHSNIISNYMAPHQESCIANYPLQSTIWYVSTVIITIHEGVMENDLHVPDLKQRFKDSK